MPITNDFANSIINASLRGEVVEFPASLFLGLHTGNPGQTGANEVVGGTYARQPLELTEPVAGVSYNAETIEYTGLPTTTVVYGSLWDALSGGTCVWTGLLEVQVTVLPDQLVQIHPGKVVVRLVEED